MKKTVVIGSEPQSAENNFICKSLYNYANLYYNH